MIPHVPRQRQHPVNARRPFDDLVDYIEENKEHDLQQSPDIDPQFGNLLDYAANPLDKITNVAKCLAVRTHGVLDISTAALEMAAVSSKNARCKDPAFHFILSWPEHEQPSSESIFDAAEHAITALGLAEHQYVIAIHGNTDNRHCHIAVNRVHPLTFKSHHIAWAQKTLHYAARESEIKHGWTHDNGLYLVRIDRHGHKLIVPNSNLGAGELRPYSHSDDREPTLPTWHDPGSLESWLKSTVSRSLKTALPKLQSWQALHAFLDQHNVSLIDTGGGGMRVRATSVETGEVLDLPASKGLRLLKRADLEKRWGPYAPSIETESVVPDTRNLTPQQLAQGANRVFNRNIDLRTPYDHILHVADHRARIAAERAGGLHGVSPGSVDARRENGEVLLPNAVQDDVGDARPRQDTDLRRPGLGEGSSRDGVNQRHRNDAQRQQRKEERAAARVDLRQRYAQYRSFVRQHDPQYEAARSTLQNDRRLALAALRKEANATRRATRNDATYGLADKLRTLAALEADTARRKLQIEKSYQQQFTELRTTRQPPLGWREWLHEQSNLGDQAAISALRGIVYQAQRDGKKTDTEAVAEEPDVDRLARDAAYRDLQHRKVLARLLEEEKNEIAIRAARSNAIRPHEADALLIRYTNIQWRVTGNGNIEYSDSDGVHVFTDRGNRLTFDRQIVTNEDIRLALLHAQQKFGQQITLTGDDSVFLARMARLADDMGLVVLNPELHSAIVEHRAQQRRAHVAPVELARPESAKSSAPSNSEVPDVRSSPTLKPNEPSPDEILKARVLAIDPRATFVLPDINDNRIVYSGPVVAVSREPETFAQHVGRSTYVLHTGPTSSLDHDATYDIRYRERVIQVNTITKGKSKGRNE